MSRELDISAWNYVELKSFRDKIDEAMKRIQQEGVPRLVEKLAGDAASLGVKLEDVLRASKKVKRANGRSKRAEAESSEL